VGQHQNLHGLRHSDRDPHPSWVFVFGFLAWQLAAAALPGASPGWSTTSYWVAGPRHEPRRIRLRAAARARALVGRDPPWHRHRHPEHHALHLRRGVPHRAGAAVSWRRAANRRRGPATSLALAFVFGQLGRLLTGVPVLSAPAAWLSGLNLTGCAVQLPAGFPLDGGRVLRAALWRRIGDFQCGTRGSHCGGGYRARPHGARRDRRALRQPGRPLAPRDGEP
jgi:hypothetical protein